MDTSNHEATFTEIGLSRSSARRILERQPGEQEGAFEKILREQHEDALIEAMRTLLTRRQADVLVYRFGLIDGKGISLAAVGKIIGVTPERVRQLERQALRKLRMGVAKNAGHILHSIYLDTRIERSPLFTRQAILEMRAKKS